MFPTAQFHDTTGYWSYPTGDAENSGYYDAYGFGFEAVYGYGPEPYAGPSTAISAVPPIPTLTYEDPPAPILPYVPPGYEVQDGWTAAPAMVQPVYPPLAGWDAEPLAPHPTFYPEHTSSDLQMGTAVPMVATPPPTQHPVPPSSGPRRAGKRDVDLTPAEVSTFKERLRRAQPPGGYKSETAIAALNNIIKDRLPATDIGLSPRPRFDEELYLEDMLKQHLGACNKIDLYQKLANRLEGMEVVNPSPVLRKRPSGSESRQTGKSQAAIRKVEASTRRRRHERAVLELASQRFELPIGKMHFSKTEVLSVALAYLITTVGPEEAEVNSTSTSNHP